MESTESVKELSAQQQILFPNKFTFPSNPL